MRFSCFNTKNGGTTKCWHIIHLSTNHWQSTNNNNNIQLRFRGGSIPIKTQLIIITTKINFKSVVSAKSEPDTITLKRNNGTIQITSQTIGSKTNMVVLNQNGGIETKTVTEDKRKLLSINEEEAVRLAHTGLYLEKCFGRPLDIEWAYENVATPTLTKHNQSSNCFQDQLFILQARPVTTLNAWNEIELKHEFDTAILSEEDTFLTKANIGEVMPGAVTALSKTIATFVSIAMEKTAGVDQSYLGDRAVSFQQHHAFLEFTNVIIIIIIWLSL